MVNYYHDMWIRRSEVLAPLIRLTSANVKFKWTNVKQMAFDKIKQIVRRETLLLFLSDASHTQLGVVISQNNKPIAFFQGNFNWLKDDIQPLNASCYLSLKHIKNLKISFWDNKSWFILTTKILLIKTLIRSMLCNGGF